MTIPKFAVGFLAARPGLAETPKSTGSKKLVAKATMEKRKLANVPYRIASSAILSSLLIAVKSADIIDVASRVPIATKDSFIAIACLESAGC